MLAQRRFRRDPCRPGVRWVTGLSGADARRRRAMPTYTDPAGRPDVSGRDRGDDGAHQILLGFETQADAEAWIARDRRQSAAAEPRMPNDLPKMHRLCPGDKS
jgi:hypothetical protein